MVIILFQQPYFQVDSDYSSNELLNQPWEPHHTMGSSAADQVICNKGLRREQRFASRPFTAGTSPTWDFTLEVPLINEELPTIHIRIMKSGRTSQDVTMGRATKPRQELRWR